MTPRRAPARRSARISARTRRLISSIFDRLDYRSLARIYCDEGGVAFWRDRRGPAQRLGLAIANALAGRLLPGGRSLYVGAGVTEIPALLIERHDLGRTVEPYTLRRAEARALNHAGAAAGLKIRGSDAVSARGTFDHLWIVSVLNDPETLPSLSALSYGRADPVTFDSVAFARERTVVRRLVDRCLRRLTVPGLVTTSVEEVPWIRDWAKRHRRETIVEAEELPTALVGDAVCFVRLERRKKVSG